MLVTEFGQALGFTIMAFVDCVQIHQARIKDTIEADLSFIFKIPNQ